MRPVYLLGLILQDRAVLVVGGGSVATRRMPALLEAGARVTVVSPGLTPALRALADSQHLTWTPRRFQPSDVDDVWLVQVAVDDPAAAAAVSAAAAARRVFCVRADDRHAASAWTPATTRHGPVTVGVSAGGDPRRAMAVRDAIHDLLARSAVVADPAPAAGTPGGVVHLVGAGPGDPELITVKGRRLLAEADVVVADRLTPGLLLDELRPEVELIDGSKIPHGPGRAQEEINVLLVQHARAGRRVVRLKGGDPYLFGRGGEELLACAAAGVAVTVVPGVTSAVAVPAAAGIPVTHRGVAHALVVVSGHLPPGDPHSLVDWSAVARLGGTICVLMGLANISAIAAVLVEHGRPAGTRVAVVQNGTTRDQRTRRTTLGLLASGTAVPGLRSPAVVVIGEVVDALAGHPM